MAAHQYIYAMEKLTKAFPPARTVVSDITLAEISVLLGWPLLIQTSASQGWTE